VMKQVNEEEKKREQEREKKEKKERANVKRSEGEIMRLIVGKVA